MISKAAGHRPAVASKLHSKRWLHVIGLLSVVVPALASGAEITRFTYREGAAYATFESADPSGCIVTNVFVQASRSATRTGGGSFTSFPIAAVVVTKFDYCRQLQLIVATGDISIFDFQSDPNHKTAMLRATIPVYDFEADRFFDILVDLTWESTSQQEVATGNTAFEDAGITVRTHFDGKARFAQAVGIVGDGTTNYAPLPSNEAQIQTVQVGELTISKPE